MTKQQLEEENKRLRMALLEIVHDTSDEEIKRARKREQESPYAYIVGRVAANAMYALYGDDYLLISRGHRDECIEKARKELEEYESTKKKVQHP